MPYIFGKLWHLAIIWAIRKAFHCILQGVRILLANHTRISPTSENDSYIFTFTFYKNWTLGLYYHFYFLQELKTKKRKNDQCVWFHLFCQTGDKRGVLYSWAIVQGGFHRNTCKWHVIKNKKNSSDLCRSQGGFLVD